MYPNLTLRIKNHIPSLIYMPSEGVEKVLTQGEENVVEVMTEIAEKLNLQHPNSEDLSQRHQDFLTIARNADDVYYTTFPDMDVESQEFKLKETIHQNLDKIIDDNPQDYEVDGLTPELMKELEQNYAVDLFSSALESMYTTLISKSLLAASELGLGTINLDDESENLRLAELMAREMEKMGVEFKVVGLPDQSEALTDEETQD